METSDKGKETDPFNSRELLSNVATAASLLKYDYQIAKSHFIQQLRQTGMFILEVVFLINISLYELYYCIDY